MKQFLLLLVACSFGWVAYGQMNWWTSSNPDLDNPMSTIEAVVYNNDLYQVCDSASQYLEIGKYDSESGQWRSMGMLQNATGNGGTFRTAISGDDWFIFVMGMGVQVFRYNFVTETFTTCTGTISGMLNDNWVIKNDPGADKIYIGYTTVVPDEVHLAVFDVTTENIQDYNYSTMLNPTQASGASMKLEMYLGNSDLYFGSSQSANYLVRASLGDLANPVYYNSGQSANGVVKLNGVALATPQFYYLTGDGQGAPWITVQNSSSYTSYEVQLSDQDVDINTGATTPQTFVVGVNDHESLEHSAYAFLVSTFSAQGTGSEDRFYLYRKDNSGSVWDSIGPKIELGSFDMQPSSLRLSLENTNQTHFALTYSSSSGTKTTRVLNNMPSVITASQTTSAGMCGGHNNLIYPRLEIEDADMDFIRILSVTSTNGNVQNGYAIPVGVDNSSSPGISKFAIYGLVQTQGSTQIEISYTDGWGIYTATLNTINIVGTAPNITFSSELSHLCDNENMISLSDYVNYVDQGVFSINGQIIPNGIINGIEYAATQPSGSLNYDVTVDGCVIETGTTYNFVNAGNASVSTLPATCGNTDGEATVFYTQGSSSVFTVEWSTGETATTISNLHPGAYYYHVTDDNGCHVTGFAGIETSTIDVSGNVTDVSCYGAKDGSLSVNVSGPANYSVIWSNGYSTETIDDLDVGTYWVTVRDLDNACEVTYNYTITQPTRLNASFWNDEPDCGFANGNFYGTYSGGAGGYTYEWLNSTQTTADLYNVGYGYYEVVVTDASNCKDTFGIQMDDLQALEINEMVFPASCNVQNGAIYLNLDANPNGGTTTPNTITWSTGAETAIIGSLGTGMYTVEVTNFSTDAPFNVCHAVKTITVPLKSPIIQPICVVTVDMSTTNLVIWGKSEFYGIDYYNIYRENAVAGEYSLIDTVDFNNLSIFNDVVASPMDKSWRYRISQVDECGTESPISPAHKTLHLNSIDVQSSSSVDIFWDEYEGQMDAAEYVVWRYTDQNGWEALSPSVPLGTSYFNDTPPGGATGLDYYVEMVKQSPCTAEKAQDFNTTRSNKDKGTFVLGQGTGDSNNALGENSFVFEVYPNPFSDEIQLNISEKGMGKLVHIYALDGTELFTATVTDMTMTVQPTNLAQGMYCWRIDGSPLTVKLIRQ